MGQFFTEGGFGMYPTALFGVLLFTVAVVYALRADKRLGPVVLTLAVLVFAAGLLAVSLGISTTTRHLHEMPLEQQFLVFTTGLSESLNNLVLATLLLVPSCLVAAVGALRSGPVAGLQKV